MMMESKRELSAMNAHLEKQLQESRTANEELRKECEKLFTENTALNLAQEQTMSHVAELEAQIEELKRQKSAIFDDCRKETDALKAKIAKMSHPVTIDDLQASTVYRSAYQITETRTTFRLDLDGSTNLKWDIPKSARFYDDNGDIVNMLTPVHVPELGRISWIMEYLPSHAIGQAKYIFCSRLREGRMMLVSPLAATHVVVICDVPEDVFQAFMRDDQKERVDTYFLINEPHDSEGTRTIFLRIPFLPEDKVVAAEVARLKDIQEDDTETIIGDTQQALAVTRDMCQKYWNETIYGTKTS